MSIWFFAAVILAGLTLLAYRWQYEVTARTRRRRRNQQWALIVSLLVAAGVAVLLGVSRG